MCIRDRSKPSQPSPRNNACNHCLLVLRYGSSQHPPFSLTPLTDTAHAPKRRTTRRGKLTELFGANGGSKTRPSDQEDEPRPGRQPMIILLRSQTVRPRPNPILTGEQTRLESMNSNKTASETRFATVRQPGMPPKQLSAEP